jgi:NADP-dependent 3-hydroxy acid dehydrogenase YdfG
MAEDPAATDKPGQRLDAARSGRRPAEPQGTAGLAGKAGQSPRFPETVTVVTGANSGIGRATAVHLASNGHRVFGTMRSLDKGAKLAEIASERGVEVTPIVLDVTDDAQVGSGFDQILEAAGRIDVLVNNAGIGMNATLADIDISKAKQLFDANVWGIVRCAQQVLPTMIEQGSGHLVQVSSVAGRIGMPGQPVYTASKWAVEGMSESLAHDLAPHGIRVSIIEPGVTRTAILPKNPDAPSGSVHADVYARMFDLYASGVVANVHPNVIAELISEAIDAEPGQMRWAAAWGAEQMRNGRPSSDSHWTDLGATAPNGPAWRERFTDLFDIAVISATGD